ncbi:hypothetical protein HAHE_13000 [Haloferula helveola]|uniref:Protein kinase domain-containing protein n=1 Tax=Haloferula helveola TaxID=490095 RepID=A0ABN6H462_9BACT|nr:hypothetical protein HAHE_13000 [Haloferula helveola]
MQQSSESSICPTCKSPIPADAPGGLCPACTLEGAACVPHTGTGGRQTPPPSIEEVAAHFPELEIIELLGAGGMGAVYKARQPQLDRFVALKILSHELAQDPAFVERFNREAKVLARLSHPNIVAVFDFGTAGPYCFLLMEYVDGVNLRQAMRTGGFKPSEALSLIQDVCSALQFAHEEGILHRDIKPENVLIDSKGRVKIADFGIAKLVGAGAPADVTLTLQGSILGSPHYMAPEQIETPGDVDQRADIYSLGVVLYEMLTGELPIGRFDLPSEKAAIDQRIDEIVLRTLAKERQARFQSAGEVGTHVAALATSPQAPAPAAAGAASGDSGSARFSLVAAILTGLSVVLAISLALINASVNASRIPDQDAYLVTGMPMFLIGIPAAIMAVVGLILGIVAIGEVRKSGGTKGGLGFAIFAVVTWPIFFMAVMVSNCLAMPMPGTGGIGMPIIVLLAGIPLLLASFTLIRGLRRWAKGVEKKDGHRHFPGLALPLLVTVGLAILGPVLAAVLPGMFGPHYDPYEDGRMEMPHEFPKFEASKEMQWHLGPPEIAYPVRLEAGLRANFILIERNEKGGNSATTLGQINFDFPETVTVEVGSAGGDAIVSSDPPALVATVDSDSRYLMLSTGTDPAGWEFRQAPSEAPVMSAGERREFELANRPGTDDSLAETLHLVVETTPLNR